jgi:hypothetical protein
LGINPGETPESDPGDRTWAGSAPTGARYQLGYEPVLVARLIWDKMEDGERSGHERDRDLKYRWREITSN